MLDLIWLPNAENQFLEMLDYIGARNPQAAARMKRLIEDRIDLARVVPGMGRLGRVKATRELIVHPNYIVVYAHTDVTITILRVLHSHQRYP